MRPKRKFHPLALALTGLLWPHASHAAKSLSLDEAIALARGQRSDASQAEVDVERGELGVLKARLERVHLTLQGTFREQYQNLNIGAGDAICSVPNACPSGEAHPFNGTALLTIPLWSGFAVEADIARAHWQDKAAAAQRRATLRTIALDVARAYWAVRRAELQRQVEQEALARNEEIERITKSRVQAGIAPPVDFNRAHLQTLRQESRVVALDGQIAQARAQLGGALELGGEVALTEDPASHVPLLPPLEVATEDAEGLRPEGVAAFTTWKAQAEAVRAAQSGYWPQVGLFAQATMQNTNFYIALQPTEIIAGNFVAGVQASWTIFDTLTTWAAVRDASLVERRTALDQRHFRFQIDAEVKTAHAHVRQLLGQRQLWTASSDVARDNLSILEKRYAAGDALLLDLLDAQVQLLAAESERVQGGVDLALADAELLAAQGRL